MICKTCKTEYTPNKEDRGFCDECELFFRDKKVNEVIDAEVDNVPKTNYW